MRPRSLWFGSAAGRRNRHGRRGQILARPLQGARKSSGAVRENDRTTGASASAGTFFVVAGGGDVGKGNNPVIKLVTVFGKPPLEGRVVINELTTVVAAFLLKRLTLGGLARIKEGFTVVRQLVDPITGHLRPVFERGANSPALVNTLADIVHGCVTSSGPSSNECGALFKVATLQRHNERPDNTLDAAENIASAWGRGQSSAFALLPTERPYMPVLSQPPAVAPIAQLQQSSSSSTDTDIRGSERSHTLDS